LLHVRKRLAQLGAGPALALMQGAAALLGHPALLFDEQ
jgi:hypothetical protein